MLKDKALVRSMVIRAVTAKQATDDLASILPISTVGEFTVIKAARFYKTLSAEPKKKTYIEIDKLLPAKKAIEVMTAIENRKPQIHIYPEDLASGFDFGRRLEVLKKVDPTTLPQDHPDHVCTDKCFSIVVDPEIIGTHRSVEVFTPEWGSDGSDCNYKFDDSANDAVRGPDTDTSNVTAGQPAPYLFPNKPLVPTKDAVFDDAIRSVNLDECAPILHPSPEVIEVVREILADPDPSRSYSYHEPEPVTATLPNPEWDEGQQGQDVSPNEVNSDYHGVYARWSAPWLTTIGTILAIAGLVLVYFHWFAK
jgi:hypothetical protein